jgi:hypothetical protein
MNMQLPASNHGPRQRDGRGRKVAAHAGARYRKRFAALRHPVRKMEAEAEHLHEIEQAGETGETPFIAMLGLVFLLLPIVVVISGLAFAAYYLAR